MKGEIMKNIIILLVILVLTAGCGEKKVDSSSDESFIRSIESVKTSLSEEKKKEFEEAVQAIAFSEIGNIFEVAVNPEGIQIKIKDNLDGKTADEIIAEGKRIIIERKKKEREQVINEIKEVKKKISEFKNQRTKAEQNKESLKQFKILRSRFYYKKSTFMDEPVIELTVKNNTKHSVSRAYFRGVLATPGRSVPWIQDSFNYKIRGGLEPGEQVTWKLKPTMFSEWGNAPTDRNDMVLTVTVIRIDGPNEKAIFDYEFSKWDKERLEELNKRLEELQKSLVILEKELI